MQFLTEAKKEAKAGRTSRKRLSFPNAFKQDSHILCTLTECLASPNFPITCSLVLHAWPAATISQPTLWCLPVLARSGGCEEISFYGLGSNSMKGGGLNFQQLENTIISNDFYSLSIFIMPSYDVF